MIDFLTPELRVDRPPAGQEVSRYVRSYLIMRIFVGALGVALPFMLVLGDGLVFDGTRARAIRSVRTTTRECANFSSVR